MAKLLVSIYIQIISLALQNLIQLMSFSQNTGLHDKITAVQESHSLSSETVKKLRYLVTIRNKLLHEHGFNKLPDRAGFAKSYDSVEKELKAKLSGSSSGCVIC